jgi:uncharacterized protein (TIGR02996 family)
VARNTREALEAAIAADFDDLAAHAAYADLLMEQGDPHGEFIGVQLALEDERRSPEERRQFGERERELLAAHGPEWLGDLWKVVVDGRGTDGDPRPTPLHWSRGWVEAAQVTHATYRLMERLARAPLTRFLRRLEIDYGYEYPHGEWDEDRQEMKPPPAVPEGTPAENEFYLPLLGAPFLTTLRYFRIGEFRGEGDPWIFHSSGRADLLAPLLERTPRLEELHMLNGTRGNPRFDPAPIFRLPLPNLRVLRAYNLFDHATAVLAANRSLGRLTHLMFHSHADDPCSRQRGPYLTLADLRNVLRSRPLRSVTHLQFRLSDIGDEGCAEIARSGALKRLRVLDLRHGRITDEGVRCLLGSNGCRNLTWLELSRNAISSAGVARLHQSGVPFAAGGQHPTDDTHWLVEGDWE